MTRVARVRLAMLVASLLGSSPAWAQSSRDGMYGRASGDLGMQADLGCAIAGGEPGAYARATLRYLQSAGVYASYLDGLGDRRGPASRSVSVGIELRPMFLPRQGLDLEQGPAWLDLFIDSLSLRLGAVVSREPHFESKAPGLEAAVGMGAPLTASASGPWLDASAAVRVSDAHLAQRDDFHLDRALLFTFTLGWQGIVGIHLVDAGDRLRR